MRALAAYATEVSDLPPAESMPRARQVAKAVADANRAWSQGLLSTRWPATSAPTAEKLAAALAARQGPLRQMAGAQTGVDWAVAGQAWDTASTEGRGLSELMRQHLGLSERPV